MKFIKTTGFALLLTLPLSLSLTACNKSKDKEAEQVTATNNTDATTESSEENVQSASSTSASQALAEMTVKNASIAMFLFLAKPDITEEQKACIKEISIDDNVPKIKGMFEENFTSEELQEALALYNSPEIKAMTEYGLQTVKIMAGVKVDKLLPEPKKSDESMKVITEFATSDLGKRLSSFEGANTLIKAEIDKKVKACGVEPTLDMLNQAAPPQ